MTCGLTGLLAQTQNLRDGITKKTERDYNLIVQVLP